MAVYTASFTADNGTSLSTIGFANCVSTGLVVNGNKAGTNLVPTVSLGNRYNDTFANDQYVQAVIDSVGSGNYFSLGLRLSGADSTLNGYTVVLGGSNEWYISRYDNGVTTDVASGTTTFTNGDTLRGEITGSTITLKVNGATVTTYGSASQYTSGQAGLILYVESSYGTFDDFEAGDLGGGGSGGLLKQLLMQQ